MDRYVQRPSQVQFRDDKGLAVEAQLHSPVDALHANETVSRWVAFASAYVFWGTVGSICLGIVLLQ